MMGKDTNSIFFKKCGLTLLKIKTAVTKSIVGNFIFVIDTGTFDGHVFFLITAAETAGAIWPSELIFIPHKPPDHR